MGFRQVTRFAQSLRGDVSGLGLGPRSACFSPDFSSCFIPVCPSDPRLQMRGANQWLQANGSSWA